MPTERAVRRRSIRPAALRTLWRILMVTSAGLIVGAAVGYGRDAWADRVRTSGQAFSISCADVDWRIPDDRRAECRPGSAIALILQRLR